MNKGTIGIKRADIKPGFRMGLCARCQAVVQLSQAGLLIQHFTQNKSQCGSSYGQPAKVWRLASVCHG